MTIHRIRGAKGNSYVLIGRNVVKIRIGGSLSGVRPAKVIDGVLHWACYSVEEAEARPRGKQSPEASDFFYVPSDRVFGNRRDAVAARNAFDKDNSRPPYHG